MNTTYEMEFKPIANIKTIKDYENEIEALRNENFELKSKLSCTQNGRSQIDPQMPQISEEIKKLLIDSQKSINILEQENFSLKNQIEKIKNPHIDDDILKTENVKLAKYIEGLNEHITNINSEKDKIEKELKVLKEEKLNLYNNVNEMIRNHEIEKKNLADNIMRYEEKIKNMEQLGENYGREKENLLNVIRNSQQEKSEMEKRIMILENNVKSSFKDNELLLAEKEQTIRRLEKENISLKEKINICNSQINQGNDRYKLLYDENKKIREKFMENEQLFNEKKDEIVRLEEENQKIKLKVFNIENNVVEKLKIENLNLKKTANNIKTTLEIKNKEIVDLQNRFKVANEKIEELMIKKNENQNFYGENSETFELNKRLNLIENEKKVLESKINEIQIDKNIIEEKYKNLKHEYKSNQALWEKTQEKRDFFSSMTKSDFVDKNNIETVYFLRNQNNELKKTEEKLKKIISDDFNQRIIVNKKINSIFNLIHLTESKLNTFKSLIVNKKEKSKRTIRKYKKHITKIQNEFINYKQRNTNDIKKTRIDHLLSSKNLELVRKYNIKDANLNDIVSKFGYIFGEMKNKIDLLESEIAQLTFLSGKGKISKETALLLENFTVEFIEAKKELDFCNEYLKRKGVEVKNYKLNQKKNEEVIKILQEKLKKFENANEEKKTSENRFNPFGIFRVK